MFHYSLKRAKIELVNADSEIDSLTLREALTDAESGRMAQDAGRIVRACARFFVEQGGDAAARRRVPRRAPTVYRDTATGLLRCVYREIVVRFKTRVAARRRRAHLSDMKLDVVRMGSSQHHFVVR